ncbi:MAG: ROK family protein [Chloroflexi bacterium]|nr:ROK family protein [Chloroflexota bacterium]
MATILGIDIGGSGIKGAAVDVENGVLLAERYRLPTPDPAKPRPVAETAAQVARYFNWTGPIGYGFPAVVRGGIVRSAANIHAKWIGVNAEELFGQAAGCPCAVVNDADAAGMAEMAFGAGRGRNGLVLVVTIGTGLGTALFIDGRLVPNTELGHIQIDGADAETNASDAARKREDLSWKQWAKRFDKYLRTLEALFSPDLFILGGGASKEHARFMQYLKVEAEILPAQMLNEAGIIGAALAARRLLE